MYQSAIGCDIFCFTKVRSICLPCYSSKERVTFLTDTISSISENLPLTTILQQHQINDKTNEIADKLVSNLSNESHMLLNDFIEDEEVVDCKAILGKCLVTGDTSGNKNCICDQMINSNEHCNKRNESNASNVSTERLRPTNTVNAKESICEDCSCSSDKTAVRNAKEYAFKKMNVRVNNHCLPEFEYGLNGTVKIINTIDIEFEGIISTGNSKSTNNNFTRQIHDIQAIPFNSCKAVLGKCIVSENGMINEDCLCAKMAIEEPQMTSQEIEEITPQCNDSSMC